VAHANAVPRPGPGPGPGKKRCATPSMLDSTREVLWLWHPKCGPRPKLDFALRGARLCPPLRSLGTNQVT